MLHLLTNEIRHYAWGSHTAIAELMCRPSPAEEPEAELWIGAHADCPSRLADGRSLCDLLDADPTTTLGAAVVDRYGPRLPFLLKVLAAAEPLSLQVHPDERQALDGYDDEERRGVPLSSNARNYRDRFPKPEVLCALGPFEALSGFRPPEVAADALGALEVAEARPVLATLRRGGGGAPAEALLELLRWPADTVGALVSAVGEAAGDAADAEPDGRFAASYRTVVDLANRYRSDPAVVGTLLLHHVTLAPGEAIYMAAGQPHAYLHGTGVELMASSDNVLRGGLTPKNVDVDALDVVLAREPWDPTPRRVSPGVEGEAVYDTPSPYFRLSRLAVDGDVALDDRGPQLLLATDGTVTVTVGGETVELSGCGSAFVSADEARDVTLTGKGTVFRATVGD